MGKMNKKSSLPDFSNQISRDMRPLNRDMTQQALLRGKNTLENSNGNSLDYAQNMRRFRDQNGVEAGGVRQSLFKNNRGSVDALGLHNKSKQ